MGDKYFYVYSYKEAIAEYQKDMAKGKLITNHQFLNLADSYFRTGDYKNASKIYLVLFPIHKRFVHSSLQIHTHR